MQLEVAKNVLHNIRAKNIRASSCSLADQEDKREWGEEIEAIDLVLEKLEQMQKENEQLNNRDTSRLSEIRRLRSKNSHLENEIKYYYIPKDKIREKIKELKEAIGIAKKENDIALVAELEIQTEILKKLLEEE